MSCLPCVTALGFAGNLWATYADGFALMVALAIAVAAIYGQVTVNDIVLARYTADAWRGRVYAVRYFLLFISAGVAIGMISLLHERGGFTLVLAANAGDCAGDVHGHRRRSRLMVTNIESAEVGAAAGGIIRTTAGSGLRL